MADRHVLHTATPSGAGSTWATAYNTVGAALAAAAAGDRILVSKDHVESAATVTWTSPGTLSNPVQILSGTQDTTSGFTSLTVGASITCTSHTSNISFRADGVIIAYGLKIFSTGATATEITIGLAAGSYFEGFDCHLEHSSGTSGSSSTRLGNTTASDGSRVILWNPTFKFNAAGQIVDYSSDVHIIGGTWPAGTAPTACFRAYASTRSAHLRVDAMDFSNCGNTFNLHGTGQGGATANFNDAIVPSGWTGLLITTGNVKLGFKISATNTMKGSTKLRINRRRVQGDITDETTIVRTSGMADPVTGTKYSLKMVTTTSAAPPNMLWTEWMVSDVLAAGSSVTLKANIVHGGATLTDRQFVMEMKCADGTYLTSRPASLLTAASNLATNSEPWDSSPGSPVYQEVGITHTPARAGAVMYRLGLAVQGTARTVYADGALAAS